MNEAGNHLILKTAAPDGITLTFSKADLRATGKARESRY